MPRFGLSGIISTSQMDLTYVCVRLCDCKCARVRVCLRVLLCACAAKLICVPECVSELYAPAKRVFVCHLERTVKVSLWSRGPVSCQTVRDAAPLKGMLSGPFLSIISPATLIKAVAVHPHVPQAATEKSHLSN